MTSPSYLYLAVPQGDERFKIGRSASPSSRIRALPSLDLDALDLERTRLLTGKARHITKAESVLHFMLESWRSPHPHGGDGHTEWFALEALATATNYVTGLARRDDRFALADPRELLHPPRSATTSRRGTRATLRAPSSEVVNERTRRLPSELAGLKGHIEWLCGHACGAKAPTREGEVLLCYDHLSRDEWDAVSSIPYEANLRGENRIIVPGSSAMRTDDLVIDFGNWHFHNGRGVGMHALRIGALKRMVTTLVGYRNEPGIDGPQLDAAVAIMSETSDAVDRLIAALPRLPADWNDTFEAHCQGAIQALTHAFRSEGCGAS